MRALNQASLNLITQWEGLRTEAYQDQKGVWTIGYGHTSAAGAPKVTKGMKITKQEALEIFERDLTLAKKGVDRLVKVTLNDNQYGALVSFVHNLGEGNFKNSTLLKKVNSKDFDAIPTELLKWVNIRINGKLTFSKGLWNRRKAEGALWKASSSSPVQSPQETTKASGEAPKAEESLLVRIIKLIFGIKE